MDNTVKNQQGYTRCYNRIFKRIISCILGGILSICVTPIVLLIGICIFLEDGFPIFYTPLRGGYKGKPFRIIKLRTMVKNADQIGGGTTKLNDSRITKVGAFLRKVKLDELPQAYNVFMGTMAFVGPRPELLQYTERYTTEEKVILEVRPGITDFSSIEFINLDEIVGAGDADEMYEKCVLNRKNELRVKYAQEVSFFTDVKLFVKTIWKVCEKAIRMISSKRN